MTHQAVNTTATRIVLLIWNIPDGFATLVGGFFVLLAAFFAWRGVLEQIKAENASLQIQLAAQHQIENDRLIQEINNLKAAIHAELFAYCRPIIHGTSVLNRTELNHGNDLGRPAALVSPTIFLGLSSKIGLLGEGEATSAVILFYVNLLALNSDAEKSAQFDMSALSAPPVSSPISLTSRPFISNPYHTPYHVLASRFRLMAVNLAKALNSLSSTRFKIPHEQNLDSLVSPGGRLIGQLPKRPEFMDELLVRLGTEG